MITKHIARPVLNTRVARAEKADVKPADGNHLYLYDRKIRLIEMEEDYMLKSKLMKALMLGICMSALTTGVAFAQMKAQTEADKGTVQSEAESRLYEKQKEIDQYVFTDHADEMAKLGFTVNYTGVSGDVVEIGISPYSDKNADYLYGLFGKDGVSVIAADENVLYALASSSGIAQPGATDGNGVDSSADGTDPDTAVTDTVDPVKAPDEAATDGKVYKDSDVQIQIESATDDVAEDADVIYYTTGVGTGENSADVKTVSAAESTDAVKRTNGDSGAVSTSVIILAIAAGAAFVGGAIMVSNKKKNK
jgi:hypothetical protein